ncbi:MAG TPA: hypothetical protein VN643_21570 [Pyrinomonadaceae bacterium]|nr:hypothetical protein [Pyrinomonadaceae bacterium]
MYRPKFCAECGEKIIRLRWRLWNSRRFCDVCSPRFFKEQSMQLGALVVGILLTGMAFGRAMRPQPPPLIIQRSEARTSNVAGSSNPGNTAPLVTEEIYMCGARTKKGTPCSRRVHGPVRCWQHKGVPAMRSQEKLIVKDLAP